MAFKLYATSDGRVPPVEYLPVSAITPKAGTVMYLSSGKLAVATGTTVPTHLCVREESTARTAGDLIPVIAIQPDMILETTASAEIAGEIGSKVTLHASSGGQVTGTATNGIATIVYKSGTASGSTVRVHF